jgi:hypothetical protein
MILAFDGVVILQEGSQEFLDGINGLLGVAHE